MTKAKTADTLAWEALQERSKPIPLDPSRGHVLHTAFRPDPERVNDICVKVVRTALGAL